VLVNNAWGGHEFFAPSSFNAPLWEQPIVQWDAMFSNGVRNHIVTLQATGPLLRRSAGRLVAAITFWDDDRYLSGNVFYDLAKAAINRLAFAAAQELRADGIASVAISPGFMQTELVLAQPHVVGQGHRCAGGFRNAALPRPRCRRARLRPGRDQRHRQRAAGRRPRPPLRVHGPRRLSAASIHATHGGLSVTLSARLAAVVDALPLRPGLRVLDAMKPAGRLRSG
jgi:NAD(P)-dependent dehydrogenase (short-subunit alcohol dehydrogenase family)